MEKDVNKLQAVRKAAGLTQQQLAEKSGVSYSLISKIESGERNISLVGVSRLTSLCEALGCQIRDIVSDQRIIDWDENTPPLFKRMQIIMEQAEIEATAERMQRLQDIKNGVVREEPKPVVERTTEKVKKTITMEVVFPADFIPPDEFDEAGWHNNWHSKCDACPFYVFTDENGNWCQYPDYGEDDSCPLKKFF